MKWGFFFVIFCSLIGCAPTPTTPATIPFPIATDTPSFSTVLPSTTSAFSRQPTIGTVASASPSTTLPTIPSTDTITPTDEMGLNFVIQVHGKLEVKRQGWKTFAPALFGTIVRYGDLLRLDSSAEAIVVCSDLTLANVPQGLNGVPCRVPQPILNYRDEKLGGTRSGTGFQDYPVIVAPRMTSVLDPHPILRWMLIPGGITYTVSVKGSGINWSQEVVSKTETIYPDDAPNLRPGETYKVTVEANQRSSDEDRTPDLGFTLLTAVQAQDVLQEEQKVQGLGLTEAQTKFLAAQIYQSHMYAGHALSAEAIETLEAISAKSGEPAIFRSLGDLYLKIGLVRLAEARYLRALELSKGLDDIEGQALTEYGLALVYSSIGNKAESVRWLQDAIRHYQDLGDSDKIQQLEKLK